MNFSKTFRWTDNKSLEIQLAWFRESFTEFSIKFINKIKCSHAGPEFTINFLKLFFCIQIYDHRHWNDDEWRFCLPDEVFCNKKQEYVVVGEDEEYVSVKHLDKHHQYEVRKKIKSV